MKLSAQLAPGSRRNQTPALANGDEAQDEATVEPAGLLIAAGRSNAEIAVRPVVREVSVRKCVCVLPAKAGARDRVSAASSA